MKFPTFLKFIFIAVALTVPSKHKTSGANTTPSSAASSVLSRCPKSQCLVRKWALIEQCSTLHDFVFSQINNWGLDKRYLEWKFLYFTVSVNWNNLWKIFVSLIRPTTSPISLLVANQILIHKYLTLPRPSDKTARLSDSRQSRWNCKKPSDCRLF